MPMNKIDLYHECMARIASALYDRENEAGHAYSTADSIAYYEAIARLPRATWDLCPPLHFKASQLRVFPA